MKSCISILLSLHFFICACFLPCNDFSIINQIPKIYEMFKTVNGETPFMEFLEEQFFDIFPDNFSKNEELDEPFEKEQHAVPVFLFSVNYIVFININYIIIEFKPINEKKSILNIIFDFYKSIYLNSIFHPPKLHFLAN
jgi:hypothetical protein